MKYLKVLFGWIKNDIRFLIFSVLALIISTYLMTIIPLFYKHAVDTVFDGQPSSLPRIISNFIDQGSTQMEKLLFLGGALLIVQGIRAFTTFYSGRNNAMFSENVAYKLRVGLYENIQNLSYTYHTHAETGDLIQRSTSDIDTVRNVIGNQIPEIFRVIFLFTFGLIQMFMINTKLTLVSLTVVPIIFIFALFFFNKIQSVFTKTDESEGKMSAVLQENLTGIRVVKAFAREKFEIDRFEKYSRTYSNNVQKIIDNMAVYWATSDGICLLQIITTIIFGAYLTLNKEITVGDLLAFSVLINYILWPVRNLARIIVDVSKSTVSVRRINEILTEPDEYQEKELLKPEIEGNITFENVSFNFNDANVATLKNISFELKKGETMAILGKTGSGKSTLAHLLVRLYDYTGGSIKIDGMELSRIDKHWVRKHIGIVLQEPFLFSKTIYDNIGIIDDHVKETEIFEAAKVASIHEDILDFDKGYKTLIGERGVTLSGGQRQRVAIARMLIKNLPIIIFDDSLSAVDTETDLTIRSALAKRAKNLTKIIITHRVSTAMEADKIIVLEDGEILETGTHSELLQNNRVYKKIWDIQTAVNLHPETNEVI